MHSFARPLRTLRFSSLVLANSGPNRLKRYSSRVLNQTDDRFSDLDRAFPVREVDVEDRIIELLGYLAEWSKLRNTRVREHNIELALLLFYLRTGDQLAKVRNVSLDAGNVPANRSRFDHLKFLMSTTSRVELPRDRASFFPFRDQAKVRIPRSL